MFEFIFLALIVLHSHENEGKASNKIFKMVLRS